MNRFLIRSAAVAGLAAMSLCLPAGASTRPQARFSPNPGPQNFLTSVQTLTARDAWAVGSYCKATCGTNALERTLVLHWNGTKWVQVPSPNPGDGPDMLLSVSGSSATDVWAVGQAVSSRGLPGPLVLHWSGRKWIRTRFTPFGTANQEDLNAVSASSARNAWIVGFVSPAVGGPANAVAAHWNGHAWQSVPVPRSRFSFLSDVSAVSVKDAWAVGDDCVTHCRRSGEVDHGTILHWNGRKWSATLVPVKTTVLTYITAVSADDAWATGNFQAGQKFVSVILHWNGRRWSSIPGVPGVAPQALAFGAKDDGWGVQGLASIRWNGSRWRQVTIPGPLTSGFFGASAAGPSDVWVVGAFCPIHPIDKCSELSATSDTLTMHWNGRSWTRK